MKSIKKIIKKLYSPRIKSNFYNLLTTDFQRVKLDNKTLRKFPEFLQYALPSISARIDYLDSSTVIIKIMYLEREGNNIIDIEKEFRVDIDDINFLEIKTT